MTNNQQQQKKILFRGPVLSQSGYGTHGRQIANWLLGLQEKHPDRYDVRFDLVPWGVTPWYVDHEECDGLIGKIIQNCSRFEDGEKPDVSFQLQLPNEWDPFLAKTNVGVTAAVESDRCHPDWVSAVDRMDLVIVPSEFTKNVFKFSGDPKTPIEVVPESWLPECKGVKRTSKKSIDLNLETDFNFLIVSQFTGNNPENDRKNLAFTLKWMLEEFKDRQDVGLIVKTNFGRQTKLDKRNCNRTLSQIIMECRQGVGPRVYLLHGHMTNKEIVGLYTHPKVKALVNLSRGEGFCLPALEAAACGLPVVATGWSAHTEFLGLGKYVKVDYSLNKVHPSRVDGNIYLENSRWANPNEQDAKRKLSRFVKSPSVPESWAKDLQKVIQKEYSPKAIQKIYDKVMKNNNIL